MSSPDLRRRLFRILLVVLFAAAALGWYFEAISRMWGANPYLTKDTNTTYDQRFYMDRAKDFALKKHEDMVPRSRMPAYPWLLSWMYDRETKPPNHRDQLERYLRFNVALSVGCLTGIFLLGRFLLGNLLAGLITLVAAFRFFVYKAVLAQPEITFYFLFLCLFLAMIHCLRSPGWRKCLGVGILAGITYLFKASVLPLLLCFGAFLTVRICLNWLKEKRPTTALRGRKLGWRHLLPAGTLILGFLLIVGGFMLRTFKEYGSPLYDPHSQYYFWAETQDELEAMQHLNLGTGRAELAPDELENEVVQEYLPKWCPDETLRNKLVARLKAGETVPLTGEFAIVPNAKTYFKTHGLSDALARVSAGLFGRRGVFFQNFKSPNGYGNYMKALGGIALLLLILTACFNRDDLINTLKAQWLPIFFVLGVFTGYLLLFAWWAQVAAHNRFFLTLLLPILFSFGLIIAWCGSRLPIDVHWGRARIRASTALCFGVFLYCLYDTGLLHRGMLWRADAEELAAEELWVDPAHISTSIKQSWKLNE